MEARELQDFALKLNAVVDLLERKSERIVSGAEQGTQALRHAAAHFGIQTRQLPGELVDAVATQARGAIQHGVDDAVRHCETQLRQAAQAAAHAARRFDEQALALQHAQRSLLWRAGLALAIGAALAAGGSAFVAWQSWRDVQRARFADDVARAMQSGVLTRCGKSLCARVGARPDRYGRRGEYVRIEQ